MKYAFADIVVNKDGDIGVIVKSWISFTGQDKTVKHEVYIRVHNRIIEYLEDDIERYLVRHKYLSEEEKEYQSNAVNNL